MDICCDQELCYKGLVVKTWCNYRLILEPTLRKMMNKNSECECQENIDEKGLNAWKMTEGGQR